MVVGFSGATYELTVFGGEGFNKCSLLSPQICAVLAAVSEVQLVCNCLVKEVMPAFFSDVCSPPSGGQGTRGEGDRGRVLWCLGELCNDWCYDKKISWGE